MANEMQPQNNKPGEQVGVAKIKSEFLVVIPRPSSKQNTPLNGDNNRTNCENTDKSEAENGESSKRKAEPSEVPAKKMKGQFKKRPVDKTARDPSVKLCFSVLRNTPCPLGESQCKYMHDIEAYQAAKPVDIGPTCYVFSTYGFCPQMLQCRFAKSHAEFDSQCLKNSNFEELQAKLTPNLNSFPKRLQIRLRKRQYNFKKAEKSWKLAEKEQKTKHQAASKSTQINNNSPDVTSTELSEVLDHTNFEEAKCADISDCRNISKSTDDSGLATNNSCNVDEPSLFLANGNDEPKMVGSCGPERSKIIFEDKLFLAPLTTCGNLPFRRICKKFGVDITCGEMAMTTNLLQGQSSEWALVKRHPTEDIFGVQICGSYPDSMTKVAQVLKEEMQIDFIDINMGCPIDLVFKKGQGSALMSRTNKLEQIIKSMNGVMKTDDDYLPLTIKFRTGIEMGQNTAHNLVPKLKDWGVDAMTLHGRSRQQRYTRQADWAYIDQCARLAAPIPFFGNGDILSYHEYNQHRASTCVSGVMIARGALYKPWLFTEIKEQRDWDISANERFDLFKDYVNFGLEHWGSDTQGVETTRKFALEWLSFLHRYIPVGVLERVPQRLNERAPPFVGRSNLETLLASPVATDWIKLTEMLLGPVPDGYQFLPKHKANAVATWTSVNVDLPSIS